MTRNPSIRESLLGDLGACASELGLWDVGSAIHEKIARSARSPIARGVALINLLEAAVLRDDPDKYQTIWRELQAQYVGMLPSELSMYAEYYAAQGVERFRSASDAIAAYQTIVTRAEQIGTQRVERMARERLDALLTMERTRS
jgi:hypothetical protein